MVGTRPTPLGAKTEMIDCYRTFTASLGLLAKWRRGAGVHHVPGSVPPITPRPEGLEINLVVLR
jgi:hypothetical protein